MHKQTFDVEVALRIRQFSSNEVCGTQGAPMKLAVQADTMLPTTTHDVSRGMSGKMSHRKFHGNSHGMTGEIWHGTEIT
jgi:hypothetical protein